MIDEVSAFVWGEEWKEIPKAKNYEVSNMGRVRRKGDGSFVGVWKNLGASGVYYRCSLTVSKGKRKNFLVHRLVAMAFHQPRPFGKNQVHHKDADRLNNVAHNLTWTTPAENNAAKDAPF